MATHRNLLAGASAAAAALLAFARQPAGEGSCGEHPTAPVPELAAGTAEKPADPFSDRPMDDGTATLPRSVGQRAGVAEQEPGRPKARASLATFPVRGVVVGVDGMPWSGLHVAPSLHTEGGALTDAAGRFEFLAPARTDVLVCDTLGYTALQSPPLRRDEELRLVVTRSIPVDVEIVDGATGLALLGANVSLVTGGKARSKETTDHQGFVRFEAVPEAGAFGLRVTRPGYHAASAPIPAGGDGRILVTLQRQQWRPTVVGTVVDAAGRAIPGAIVALGKARARTRASGRFELEVAAAAGATLTAHHPLQGADAQALSQAAQPAGEPLVVTLVLEAQPSESTPVWIRDPSGRALGDVRLVPVDAHGDANPLAPHWLTGRTDSEGKIVLPPGAVEFAAVDKSGAVLARVKR